MSKITTIPFLLIFLFISCSVQDNNPEQILSNSFYADGKKFTTKYAYSFKDTSSKEVLILSSANRFDQNYTETRAVFNLQFSGTELTIGKYSIYNGGINASTVKFNKDIKVVNGTTTSTGTPILKSAYKYNNKISGHATINSLTLSNTGVLTNIKMTYNFKWKGKYVRGKFNGEVRAIAIP